MFRDLLAGAQPEREMDPLDWLRKAYAAYMINPAHFE